MPSITPAIMLKLREVWGAKSTDPTNIMLWAACCTAFFGILQSGEITTSSLKEYDAEVHLSFGDIPLDSTHNPTVAQVRIKASKTDPFRQGISIFLGRTDTLLCPIAALTAYMATRGCSQGPFSTSQITSLLQGSCSWNTYAELFKRLGWTLRNSRATASG